jgi:3-hydroxyisobutyrate dehydrogenase-like beta-hydroxyacid dehydrogenase
MGASLGAVLRDSGHQVRWVRSGRSPATTERADAAGLQAVQDMAALVAESDVIVSVCPPGAATDVAAAVSDEGFSGTFVDANAVAPATVRAIATAVDDNDARFVDGGIIGPPPRDGSRTLLYLSGDAAASSTVGELFAGSPVETVLLGGGPGAASATKMAFAAWTKGTSALLLAVRAQAEREGVVEGLDHAWSAMTPDLPARLAATAAATGPKAWRFEAEMREIASTFAAAGLPPGFHEAAAEIYGRLDDLRDRDDVAVDDVIDRLTRD